MTHEDAVASGKRPRVEKEGARSEWPVLLRSILDEKRTMYTTLLYWTHIGRIKERGLIMYERTAR